MAAFRSARPAPISIAAAVWSSLYVISKISYAVRGRLGVTGGPDVSADAYAGYEPGAVTAAQWGNAGIGVIVLGLVLLPLLPAARTLNRWILTIGLGLIAGLLLLGTAAFLGRALLTDAGGLPFGLYCLVWTALVGAVSITHHRSAPPRGQAGGDSPRYVPKDHRLPSGSAQENS